MARMLSMTLLTAGACKGVVTEPLNRIATAAERLGSRGEESLGAVDRLLWWVTAGVVALLVLAMAWHKRSEAARHDRHSHGTVARGPGTGAGVSAR